MSEAEALRVLGNGQLPSMAQLRKAALKAALAEAAKTAKGKTELTLTAAKILGVSQYTVYAWKSEFRLRD